MTTTKLNLIEEWLLSTPNGRDILRQERDFFIKSTNLVFGEYSLQIGLSELNLLQGNRILNHYTIGNELICDSKFLPFKNDSFSLIICPHLLEIEQNYQHVLQELYRILSPNGTLIISALNDKSWLKLAQKKDNFLSQIQLINLDKLKNQLEQLNFGIVGGCFYSYTPLCNSAEKLRKLSWLDKAGDRWFPSLSNAFTLVMKKDLVKPNIMKKSVWLKQKQLKRSEQLAKCKQN